MKWSVVTILLLLLVSGCRTAADLETVTEYPLMNDTAPVYPDLGRAPEIANEVWINADIPIRLADQQEKVVLLEFWTFGCINCRRTAPTINRFFDTYGGDGFIVLGIHYPEFAYEREYDNVVEAVGRYEIEYPVALDNEGQTWRAYNQRFWPTTYLIDKSGRIRYKHIGEFNQTSAAAAAEAIEALLVEEPLIVVE